VRCFFAAAPAMTCVLVEHAACASHTSRKCAFFNVLSLLDIKLFFPST
jgi:hypothetical protein